jgi:parallel beta-helix repeat protein
MKSRIMDFRRCSLAVGLALLAMAQCFGSTGASGADTINVQGMLKTSDGVPLPTATYNMQFSLYNVASSGTALWSETHNGANKVQVTQGLYGAALGGLTLFAADFFSANADLWLEIAVDTNDNGSFEGDEVFSPRMKLASAPYAHQAKNAATLQGQNASAFAAASHTHDAGAIVSGTIPEARIDSAIARDSELPPRLFDAIVAPTGGDYTTIQAALAASKKTIFVRNGTYTLSSEISITQDGTQIVGESRNGVIIDCNNTAYNIEALGDTANTIGGTVAVNNGSQTVTGTSTSWTATLNGKYIRLGGEWYKIQSVGSATALTLYETYRGPTLSGGGYKIAGMLKDLRIENLTVKNNLAGDSGGIKFEWVLSSTVFNCTFEHNPDGIFLKEAYHCKINKNFCRNNGYQGINLRDSCEFNDVYENSCTNNNQNGIAVLDYSHLNSLSGNSCNNNGEHGIYLSGNGDNKVAGNLCLNNNQSGIAADSAWSLSIIGNSCQSNNSSGIFLVNSSGNMIGGNVCTSNSWQGVDISSGCANNTISSNRCSYNLINGIYVGSGNSNSIILGNQCANNTNLAIYNTGTGTIIEHNSP